MLSENGLGIVLLSAVPRLLKNCLRLADRLVRSQPKQMNIF